MKGIKYVTIRDAKNYTLDEIRNFIYKQWQENYTDVPFKTLIKIFDEFQPQEKLYEILNNSKNASIILIKNKIINGVIILASKDGLNLEYIVSSLQRRGLGKELWDNALSKFPNWKNTKVKVKAENYVGINFYKKLGFKPVDKLSEFVDNYNAKVIIMTLDRTEYTSK